MAGVGMVAAVAVAMAVGGALAIVAVAETAARAAQEAAAGKGVEGEMAAVAAAAVSPDNFRCHGGTHARRNTYRRTTCCPLATGTTRGRLGM